MNTLVDTNVPVRSMQKGHPACRWLDEYYARDLGVHYTELTIGPL